MNIIFLDIDGVLNAHEDIQPDVLSATIDKGKVARLNHILRATGAKIVLTSAWRYFVHRGEMNIAGLDWLLRTHGILADRLVGITEPDTMIPASTPYNGDPKTWPMADERGHQISGWLLLEGVALANARLAGFRYVAIDDMDLGITAAGHPLVHIDGKRGLQHEDAQLAIKILNH